MEFACLWAKVKTTYVCVIPWLLSGSQEHVNFKAFDKETSVCAETPKQVEATAYRTVQRRDATQRALLFYSLLFSWLKLKPAAFVL